MYLVARHGSRHHYNKLLPARAVIDVTPLLSTRKIAPTCSTAYRLDEGLCLQFIFLVRKISWRFWGKIFFSPLLFFWVFFKMLSFLLSSILTVLRFFSHLRALVSKEFINKVHCYYQYFLEKIQKLRKEMSIFLDFIFPET